MLDRIMPKKCLPTLLCILVALTLGCASSGGAVNSDFSNALERAQVDPAHPFRLEMHCNDGTKIRSLTVYHGRMGIWNNETQVNIDAQARSELLGMLVDAGFESFETYYGGLRDPESVGAALRLTCRIYLALDGEEKSSAQRYEGEQSEELLGLANRMLDRVETLVPDGVSAASLEDGLAKLADGRLAPELLSLRLIRLPERADDETGYILRVDAGMISRSQYAPGQLIEAAQAAPLSQCQLERILTALNSEQVLSLPLNLKHDGLVELDVSVFRHEKQLIARTGFQAATGPQQRAFADLLAKLDQLPAVECPPE